MRSWSANVCNNSTWLAANAPASLRDTVITPIGWTSRSIQCGSKSTQTRAIAVLRARIDLRVRNIDRRSLQNAASRKYCNFRAHWILVPEKLLGIGQSPARGPDPAQLAKNGPGLLQRLLARDRDVVPVEISGWPVCPGISPRKLPHMGGQRKRAQSLQPASVQARFIICYPAAILRPPAASLPPGRISSCRSTV